jgi:ribosomal protein S18 acetylase RimI-like enzyme
MSLIARPAGPGDIDQLSLTLAGAFFSDPLWSWAFDDPATRSAGQEALWRLSLEGSIAHGWVWTTAGHEAAAVWIPPGHPELSPPFDAQLGPLLDRVLGGRAPLVHEIFEQFDRGRPTDSPHFYLSLLGTHPDHRGRGIGMGLLTRTLEEIDTHHAAAYLESSNPANLGRYQALGFESMGELEMPDDCPGVTRMWRPAR